MENSTFGVRGYFSNLLFPEFASSVLGTINYSVVNNHIWQKSRCEIFLFTLIFCRNWYIILRVILLLFILFSQFKMQERASTTGKQKRKFQIQNKWITLNITWKFLISLYNKKVDMSIRFYVMMLRFWQSCLCRKDPLLYCGLHRIKSTALVTSLMQIVGYVCVFVFFC